MRFLTIVMQIFMNWRFWAAAVFLLTLYPLVGQITALDKKAKPLYRIARNTPKVKTPAETAPAEEENADDAKTA